MLLPLTTAQVSAETAGAVVERHAPAKAAAERAVRATMR
jgi:hypothetical protein